MHIKSSEIDIYFAALLAHMAAQGSSIQHAAYHPAACLRQQQMQVQHLPVHSTPFHSIPGSIATDDCTPLDVNLNPLSGKGMFSEFKSKGWMAVAGSPNVCA